MSLNIGIVGLPNVGKSTLFNTLTNLNVDASNYPFCTIDPNVGVVALEDERLKTIAKIVETEKIIYSVVEFIDIAGLVKGASKGEGLGNKFLSNIREVDAILHVVRNFEDGDVIHVDSSISPERDIKTINTELILKDIETIEKRIGSLKKDAKFDTKVNKIVMEFEKLLKHLSLENLAKDFEFNQSDDDLRIAISQLHLLTNKPVLYLLNSNSDSKKEIPEVLRNLDESSILFFDIKTANELSKLSKSEREEYISELGIDTLSVQDLIRRCYYLLGLISFFTAGKQEARAWTIKKGTTIEKAAGEIHTDFSRNFIASDVVSCDDFLNSKGWVDLKSRGKIRLEGKGYVVEDADVVIIKHNS